VTSSTPTDHQPPRQAQSFGSWTVTSPAQLRVLRTQLRHLTSLWALPDDCTDRILVIVNELTSNAIDHARTTCAITVRHSKALVRVLVADGSPLPPRMAPYDVHATRGRGLQMVKAMANRWGWTPRSGGKTVWASVNYSQP
jgi:two-component sensor histidine kinase